MTYMRHWIVTALEAAAQRITQASEEVTNRCWIATQRAKQKKKEEEKESKKEEEGRSTTKLTLLDICAKGLQPSSLEINATDDGITVASSAKGGSDHV